LIVPLNLYTIDGLSFLLTRSQEADAFYSKLGASGQAVEHRMDLKYNLFKGVSFRLKGTKDEEAAAKKIEAMPAVKQIWPVRAYPIPNDEVHWTANDKTVPPSAALQKRQNAGNDTFSPHVMTQVDQLRYQGIVGDGIKIAVVDTGTDYNHPALGGGFGPGYLVSFGTDLVGDNYDGFNVPVPDPDPYDNCEGHGTHVAGIIAAQANPYDFTGAAPGVTLGSYRVFGCGGSAGNDVLIAAFNQAYQDGADIITASIGGASGWTEDAWSVAVQRIVEAGVPCTVSAGNDGAEGQFYTSTAANGKRVSAIASVDNTQAPAILLNATYTVSNASTSAFGWTSGTPSNWNNISLPLWSVNYNTSDPANACAALPDDTPDLSGYIVLVRRGTCTFVQKVTK
jgi:subtilisin family serine protease